MKVAVLKCGDDRLIGYAAAPDNDRITFGAYVPGDDGNHYDELILIGKADPIKHPACATKWWQWVKEEGFGKFGYKMDEDFPFDLEEVEIAILNVP